MLKKTLYFGNPTYLSCRNKQLVIELPEITKANMHPSLQQKGVITRPIEDIGVVVLDNPQITITQATLENLLQNRCAVITCDNKRMPLGLLLPLYGNTTQNERFRHQLSASKPLQKQLWQQTIESKINNQAFILNRFRNDEALNLKVWAREVKSGDSTNLEARAAAYYWKTLFGTIPGFIREREGVPPNNLLNYGYAILRAVVARALVISGLIPTLGIHHHNKYNPFCLADDIMEPYRPFVDKQVLRIMSSLGASEVLTRAEKAELLLIPTLDVWMENKKRPLMVAVSQTTASLCKCFKGESRKIDYPSMSQYG